ncbi:MAG: YegS/Rv2252/BmrU family lipid kinase [Bacilli bacterium]|nr:YegS/Rv2252/BmrU family lipid kinase [Bacilli bacterium]
MKHLIVFNPGSGKNNEQVESFKQFINERFAGLDYEIYETTGPRSVIPFLKEYLKNNKETVRVYACGGDGTVHEVANGLVGFNNAELAILPIGTGNDFLKYYGVNGENIDQYRDFAPLINGEAQPIDLTKISGEGLNEPWYSINVINFGFDAIVDAMGNYYKEHGLPEGTKEGTNPYDYALKHDAMKHGRFNDIEVYADGEKLNEKQLLLATLAQGSYVGGQFKCAPKSKNDDGLIDVCVLKTMTYLGLGMIIGTYTKGKHLDKPRKKIVYRQAKEIKMVAPKDFDVCVDGEMIKGNNFVVEVCPKAIKLVAPRTK